jgi:hypothetical protein
MFASWQQMSFRGRGRQLARKSLISVSFSAKKPIVFDVLLRNGTFNQLYSINSIFPGLKTTNLSFWPQKTELIFRVHMDNSMCHNGSKVTLKIKKNRISGMRHQHYSPDRSPCDVPFFDMSKQILRNREFSSSDEAEDTIGQVWNDLTFDHVQSMFRDWIWRLTRAAENDGEYISE